MTEFIVAVHRPPVEQRIRLQQVLNWSEPNTREGPAGMVKRQKVRQLLGEAT
jgi:hypothetical protein